jgi:hypothetical protein
VNYLTTSPYATVQQLVFPSSFSLLGVLTQGTHETFTTTYMWSLCMRVNEQKAEPTGSILGDFVDTLNGYSPELTHDSCFGCCCWDRRSGIEAAVKPRGAYLAVPSVPDDCGDFGFL